MLTQELVRELFDYVPETGDLIWKVYKGSRAEKGDISGCFCKGYLVTRVNSKTVYNHQIIFLLHHGYLPKYIDHIDRNPLNNRIENLREANNSQNHANRPKPSNNNSGHKGVSWDVKNNMWYAKIMVQYKSQWLGRFLDIVDAAVAYNMAAEQHFGEFAYYNGPEDNQAWGIFYD